MNQRRNQATAENRNARRIAFVQACWHKDIVDRCRASFTAGNRQARVRRTATLTSLKWTDCWKFLRMMRGIAPAAGRMPVASVPKVQQ
jgi:hypothetical protein